MLDDQQLLRRYAADGSEAAFGELVARYVNLVYSAALRRTGGDAHLAQDVAQLVFTDLARKARSLPENVVLAGWLHRATRYAAAQLLRTERRRAAREQEAITMNSILSEADSDPSRRSPTEADWAQIRPLLDQALDELGDDDRDALILRFFDQRSLAEVGQALGSNEDAARKRITRALEKLRADLVRRGITTTAATLSAVISVNAVQVAPVGLAAALSTTAIAGTTLAAAAATATKTIAMTTLQKTLIGATLVAAVGTGIYEARQASNARAEGESLRQQQAVLTDQIEQLRRERDDATNRLASIANQSATLNKTPSELLKLRGEVARLRADSNDPTELAAKALMAKVEKLKQRMQDTPDARIPELQLLTEQDWLTIANRNLDTDTDYRQALAVARQVADGKWGETLHKALYRFGKEHNGQFPTDLAQLKTCFDSPVDDALLQRWQIAAANTVPKRVDGGNWVITQKAAVDAEFDQRHVIGLNGYNVTGFFPSSGWLADTLATLRSAYSAANKGQKITDTSQLLPYATTPEQKAALQMIQRQKSPVR